MINSVGAAKEYFRKDNKVLSKWGLQKQGSVNQRKGSGKDRSNSQGKGLWLEWVGCCQETEKMPQRHEGRRQERDILDG